MLGGGGPTQWRHLPSFPFVNSCFCFLLKLPVFFLMLLFFCKRTWDRFFQFTPLPRFTTVQPAQFEIVSLDHFELCRILPFLHWGEGNVLEAFPIAPDLWNNHIPIKQKGLYFQSPIVLAQGAQTLKTVQSITQRIKLQLWFIYWNNKTEAAACKSTH